MEHIRNIIKQIETPELQTPVEDKPSPELEKFNWQFNTFGDSRLVAMLESAKSFCREMTAAGKPRWLSFLGTSGAGKTHLARCISRYFRDAARWYVEPKTGSNLVRPGGFVSWRKSVDHLRSGSYSEFRDLCDDWFLCVDDIGAEQQTPFIISKLDELCDARQGKWTVLTANLSMQQIHDTFSARIASRMIRNGSVVVDVNVPDFNLRKAAA